MSKYLYCQKHQYPYFEDYIHTFVNELQLTLIIVDYFDNIQYETYNVYIFISKIPKNIPNNIKILFINTEQLTRKSLLEYVQSIDSRNIPILNYNECNQQIIPNSYLLRYQYQKEEIKRCNQQLYDVAFVGTLSQRRLEICQKLKRLGISIIHVQGWGQERDEKIMQARILLNIHYDEDYRIYESLRCDRWIFNGMIVISEKSEREDLLDIQDYYISVDYSEIIGKVQEICNSKIQKPFDLTTLIQNRHHDVMKIQELIMDPNRIFK